MAVVKVIEIIAESTKSWEDAAQQALEEASKTVRGIRSIWVQDLQAIVEDGNIVAYRANCKLSFVVESEAKKAPSGPQPQIIPALASYFTASAMWP
ncbi:dodecin family protein [Allomeiothermus silvanus]|uniref:dodecin family protein n=1 Tax=Allomeiothermus silvanus TaxID=52022 RepID=UPI0023F42D2E|nr:dodecin family protein [Allomeiothermus silvanus]